ncbi:rCG34227 [Rattus norvegicus]|uniref:RCG34227 n=1 Tax=Rattus norvegicus TaxID=10116 RepID=A6HIF9_RAT|nr:rCG34227 [Rattus norvegicus]
MKVTPASSHSLLPCYSLLDTNCNNSLKYLHFISGQSPSTLN